MGREFWSGLRPSTLEQALMRFLKNARDFKGILENSSQALLDRNSPTLEQGSLLRRRNRRRDVFPGNAWGGA